MKELEPQYRRMIDASKKLRDFVAKERRSGVFRECEGCGVFHQYEEDPFDNRLGVDLDRYIYELEKINHLLTRTMPDRIKIQVQKGTTMYESAYMHLERENLFRKLRWMQKQELMAKDPSHIARWAKDIVEDMWMQCGSASWRRECLFKHDTTDIGCKINRKLGVGLLDEDLEWVDDDLDSELGSLFFGIHGSDGD